jgi:PBP1b-binding outer membrane lipoprotein LpoB
MKYTDLVILCLVIISIMLIGGCSTHEVPKEHVSPIEEFKRQWQKELDEKHKRMIKESKYAELRSSK